MCSSPTLPPSPTPLTAARHQAMLVRRIQLRHYRRDLRHSGESSGARRGVASAAVVRAQPWLGCLPHLPRNPGPTPRGAHPYAHQGPLQSSCAAASRTVPTGSAWLEKADSGGVWWGARGWGGGVKRSARRGGGARWRRARGRAGGGGARTARCGEALVRARARHTERNPCGSGTSSSV